jgi:hypothetical protein
MGMDLLSAAIKFHPGKVEPTMRLLGSDEVLAQLRSGMSGREILKETRVQLWQFKETKRKYLI